MSLQLIYFSPFLMSNEFKLTSAEPDPLSFHGKFDFDARVC